jgi:hypothetical protein
MKVRAYLRVGYDARRRKSVVEAKAKPSTRMLRASNGNDLPTVAFAIDLEVPDEMFKQAERVIATLTIPPENATIAAEVTQ